MNLASYVTGSLRALGPSTEWPAAFDLSRRGFQHSFLALPLMMGCIYVCALAVQTERAKMLDAEAPTAIALAPFLIITGLYAFTFSAVAYLIALVFDKQDRFRPWVIIRHWAVFFAALIAALGAALYLLGVLPFVFVNGLALVIYLGWLVIDIRLAQKIAEFDWGGAVLTGCIIHAMSLTVILTGAAQIGS